MLSLIKVKILAEGYGFFLTLVLVRPNGGVAEDVIALGIFEARVSGISCTFSNSSSLIVFNIRLRGRLIFRSFCLIIGHPVTGLLRQLRTRSEIRSIIFDPGIGLSSIMICPVLSHFIWFFNVLNNATPLFFTVIGRLYSKIVFKSFSSVSLTSFSGVDTVSLSL